MGWRGVVAMALALSGLMSGVQAQPWQPGAWRTDWWRNGSTLDMDFANNRYMVSLTTPVTYTSLTQFITAVSGTFTRAGANETATGDPFYLAANQSFVSRATSTTQLTATGSPFYADASQAFYSRATSATYFDSSGVMQTAAVNVARADYDPVTLAYKGVLIEPARTNYISNSTMQWSFLWPVGWSAAGYGVTPTVVASGTVSGMNYIDVQFLGVGDTVSRAFSQRYTNINFDNVVSTSGGTAWAASAYIGYVSGSYPSGTNKSARLLTALASISGSYLGELNYAQGSVLNYTGALKRVGTAGTTTSATAFVRPYFQLTYDQGESVDLTLRFAAPQIEMGVSSTSFIPTISAPVTRAADVYTQQTASYFDSTGTLKFATAGAARADYHPSTLAYRGILAEPARTNLQYYSNDFSLWPNGSGVSVTQNVTGPDGNVSAWTLTQTDANGTDSRRQFNWGVVSDTSPYVFSIFVRKTASAPSTYPAIQLGAVGYIALSTVQINPYTGAIYKTGSGTAGIIDSGSYWRVWAAITNNNQSTIFAQLYPSWTATWGSARATVMGGSAVFYGAQLEQASVPSSYIPTYSVPASRAADVYTSAYSGTYFDASGTLRNAPANTPRLDYDPSTSEPKGVLIEEVRTNYVTHSESGVDITSGNTNPLSFVTATSVLAPNGSGTMLKCVGGNGGSDICRWIINMAPATTYTVSLFMKLAERPYLRLLAYDKSGYIRSSSVNLQNGTIAACNKTMPGSERIQALSNGMYRVVMTFTTSSTDLGYGSYFDIRMVPSASSGCSGDNSAADGVSGVYFWGAQLEQGAFPTSYIPTSGSSVTRPADVFKIPTSSGWYNPTEGTSLVVADHASLISVTTGAIALEMYKSTNVNCHRVLFGEDSSGRHSYRMYGSDDCSVWDGRDNDTIGPGLLTMGGALKGGDSAIGAHGTLFKTNSIPMPNIDTLSLGSSHGTLFWNRPIRRVTYFPTRQPDHSLPDYTR